jgi:Zn-finger nucleic acid-binding protein
MSDRQGIEIDYCPQCRGVWLDRGELDKIIERSVGGRTAPAAQPVMQAPHQPYVSPMQNRNQQGYYNERRDSHNHDHDHHHDHHRRKSFWNDLFD